MLKHNYHTHTVYCHHAYNTAEEMIVAAINFGYKTIGFSEHAPLKPRRNFRLNTNELDDYINEINQLKYKYKDQIEVLCGFECEYHRDEKLYYQNIKNMKGVDYLILGNHNMGNPHNAQEWNVANVNLQMYCEQLIDGIKSELFAMIAHPDFIFRYYPTWDHHCIDISNKMIQQAIQSNIPFEFNLNGLANKRTSMDYPNDEFWKIVSKAPLKVLIQADAHQIEAMNKTIYERGIKLIKEWGLQKNIIDKLNLK